jgi:4-amino-4-deoxy-L-arabinose transferase-like glycosyltransferase
MGFAREVAYAQGRRVGLCARAPSRIPAPHKSPSLQLSASCQTCFGVRSLIAATRARLPLLWDVNHALPWAVQQAHEELEDDAGMYQVSLLRS